MGTTSTNLEMSFTPLPIQFQVLSLLVQAPNAVTAPILLANTIVAPAHIMGALQGGYDSGGWKRTTE